MLEVLLYFLYKGYHPHKIFRGAKRALIASSVEVLRLYLSMRVKVVWSFLAFREVAFKWFLIVRHNELIFKSDVGENIRLSLVETKK